MTTVHTISTARIEDHGFVRESHWHRAERLYEEIIGEGQFVALIEGVTNEEGLDWTLTDPEKPGRLIVIGAENYIDLSEAEAWVRDHYEVFSVHAMTDEPAMPAWSDEDSAEVQRSMDEAGAQEDPLVTLSRQIDLERTPPVIPTEPLEQSEYLDNLEAKVREVSYDMVERALLRFPNDAAAALRYASALLAVAAEEV